MVIIGAVYFFEEKYILDDYNEQVLAQLKENVYNKDNRVEFFLIRLKQMFSFYLILMKLFYFLRKI